MFFLCIFLPFFQKIDFSFIWCKVYGKFTLPCKTVIFHRILSENSRMNGDLLPFNMVFLTNNFVCHDDKTLITWKNVAVQAFGKQRRKK